MSPKDANVVKPRTKQRVAIVIANPAVSTTAGWPVGFWCSGLTCPDHAFAKAGHEAEIFASDGGRCEADAMSDPNDASGYSSADLISPGFIHTPDLSAPVEATKPVADLDLARFECAAELHRVFAAFHRAGKRRVAARVSWRRASA